MNFKKQLFSVFTLLLISSFLTSCGSNKQKKVFNTEPVSIKQFDTPPGADPSVSADDGGEGFTGDGWETNDSYNTLGNPDAVKGGQITLSIPAFPATLRTVGKESNSYFNRAAESMMYEALLSLDPITEEFTPLLATHWKMSEDKKQFWFRINPDARWADGKPVTSDDVIATWKLLVDPGILEAYTNILYQTYEEPVAESKYIVSVKTKDLNWRQFLYFAASMTILPAHYISDLTGSEYVEKYQFNYIPGSGPYLIQTEDIQSGRYIIIRRRSDYWAENERWNTGLNNFDLVRVDVVQDPNLEFEKFKKGDIDVMDLSGITRISSWKELEKNELVERGLIQRTMVFNEQPAGTRGLCFNMRRAPFDDIRIRKAFAHLFDREKFKERLYDNMIGLLDSYYQNSPYQNPDNIQIRYDYNEAVRLLAEAGWSEKNRDGYLVKDGRIFEVELPFGSPMLEQFLTIYQEDLKAAGIKLSLRQIDGPTNFKLGNERNFSVLYAAWGGLVFPNPESSVKSNTADEPNTTNWPGVKNERIDELCDEYNITFDRQRRIEIIREIDGIQTSLVPYALAWYYPSSNLAFHNKFGFPKGMLSRTEDYYRSIPTMWFNDPDKDSEYSAARADKNLKMSIGPFESKYWMKIKDLRDAAGTGEVDYESVEE